MVGQSIEVANGKFGMMGNCILTDVHDNIYATPAAGEASIHSAFVGVKSDHTGDRRVFPVGKLQGLRFMCLYRFKLWWMMQRIGNCGREIPLETQFLIVEASRSADESEDGLYNQSSFYAVFLPILEGDFRAVLQGNANDELEICLESGDPAVNKFEGRHLIFVAAGSNPFDVITYAVKSVEGHLQTFCHREGKKTADLLNWFGWCTWDAFYTDVTADGVKQGLESFKKGGVPPKFVIIDDGWQSVGMDPTGIESKADDTANFADRLIDIKENPKFQKDGEGLSHFVTEIKEQHLLKYVYVWHAITGYWGGVKPGAAEMESYEPMLVNPISSPGIRASALCSVVDSITKNKVGLVNPEKVFKFYDELHSYLALAGIDGVKVDSQSILETLGAGYGGRLRLARKYHQALEESISRNFHDNGIIYCMSHNTDTLYCAKKAGVIRASDDFFPRDPASHTIHIASVAYNTIFIGEFMQPDWDMFHSLHPMAEYHGAARAVGGCAVYVSDKPGQHDFKLLRKLVLPDGSTLRAKLPGRPTRDCLFSDPTHDGKSLLKIWNLNDFTGVIGVFNCQGARWCEVRKKNIIHNDLPTVLTGTVRAEDIEYLPRVADSAWNGDTIIYSHLRGKLAYLPRNRSLSVTLKAREYEVVTVVPVKELCNGVALAPIGLLKMFNSGGAIKELTYEADRSASVWMKVHGCGLFGVYSSVRPKKITVERDEVGFEYEQETGLVTVDLKTPKQELCLWGLTIELD